MVNRVVELKTGKGAGRLGLFGGTFNPIHLGHLLVAAAAKEELSLDQVFFIPAALSPFKPESNPLAPSDRLRLLRLALAGRPAYQIDPQELDRGGISYSIETIRTYQSRFPGSELFYLIGADHVPNLLKWREAAEVAAACHFVALPRPGLEPTAFPPPFKGSYLGGFPVQLSSSQIRERVRSGQAIDHLVPAAVAEAICNNRFYLDPN